MKLFPVLAFAAVCIAAASSMGCAADTSNAGSTSQAIEHQDKTLLVSDIDDTIKRTDVLNKAEAAINALQSHDAFGGMPTLYNQWHGENTDSKQIIYLSAAPGPLIELSKRFLKNSSFPGDTSDVTRSVISGRSLTESAGEFKTKKLLELYDQQVAAGTVPDNYILIGDNGEQDMIAYGNFIDYVASKGGDTSHIYSFIHHVYDTPTGSEIAAPHRSWVTAGDLAVQLRQLNLINDASLGSVLSDVASDASSDTDQVVPGFMSCSQFDNWPTLDGSVGTDDYASVESTVKDLCAQSAD
jgi:hypothetical protein